MKKTRKILVEVEVTTDKTFGDISRAIKHGIYYGLDVKRVSPPKNVDITIKD